MNKPILLIPDRHWDELSRSALLAALPMLIQLGYDTYCSELPESYTALQQLETVKHTITSIEQMQQAAKPYLEARNIDVESLCQLPFEDLCHYMRNYVSSKKFNEYALCLKELPAHRMTLQILEKVLELHGSIQGVEMTNNKFNGYATLGDFNLAEKAKNIQEQETDRIKNFVTHAINLQNKGNGVILLIGMSHYNNLLQKFYEHGHLKEIVVLFPYNNRCFSRVYEDRKLNVTDPKGLSIGLYK